MNLVVFLTSLVNVLSKEDNTKPLETPMPNKNQLQYVESDDEILLETHCRFLNLSLYL